MPLTYNIPLMW